MKDGRKLSYFARLRITLILLMLVCFETLSFDQQILTCQPEKERPYENTSSPRHSGKLRSQIELIFTSIRFCSLNDTTTQTGVSRSLKDKNARYLECKTPRLNLSSLAQLETSRQGIWSPYTDYRTGSLNHAVHGKAQAESTEKLRGSPQRPRETPQCCSDKRDSYKACVTRHDQGPDGAKQKLEQLECVHGSGGYRQPVSHDHNKHCPFYRRWHRPRFTWFKQSESTDTEPLDTTNCRLNRETVALLKERILHTVETLTKAKQAGAGKRVRRLERRRWNVDAVPNPRGQAQRDCLRWIKPQADLLGLERSGSGKARTRSLVDVLLMSEQQRPGSDTAGGARSIIRLLVSVAAIVRLLGDQRRRKGKEPAKDCSRFSLLPRTGADNRTVRLNTDLSYCKNCKVYCVECFFCALQLFGRNAVRLSGENKHEVMVSRAPDSIDAGGKGWPFLDSEYPGVRVIPPTTIWVCPATSFLPNVNAGNGSFLDHVGYRLASLAALPASCNLSRVRLAEAGFHFNPRTNPSAVLCHRCGATLSLDMDTTVTPPLAFHRSSSPRCPFLRSVLDQFTEIPPSSSIAESTAVSSAALAATAMPAPPTLNRGADHADGSDLSEDSEGTLPAPRQSNSQPLPNTQPSTGYTLALSSNATDQPSPSQLSRQGAAGPSGRGVIDSGTDRDDRPVMELGSAVYPQFSTAQSRLTTFHHWPLTALFLPQTLASMGFYYAGYADCVRCFYCGVGLKSWAEDDDPLVEHVRWRPQCGFLLATKGRQFIHGVLSRIGNTNSQDDSQTLPANPCQPQQRQTTPTSSTSTSGLTTTSDGQAVSSGSEQSGQVHVRQQLLTMGFTSQQIESAQERLRRTGEEENLERLLAALIPE